MSSGLALPLARLWGWLSSGIAGVYLYYFHLVCCGVAVFLGFGRQMCLCGMNSLGLHSDSLILKAFPYLVIMTD